MATNGHQRITRQGPSRARRREREATMSEVTEQQLEDMEALKVIQRPDLLWELYDSFGAPE